LLIAFSVRCKKANQVLPAMGESYLLLFFEKEVLR